ncbi:MAG TPA: hypothetical protein VM512_15650 [Burkholderiaceae bacterium]|nr:hypothetical protein [Burkholderiaceae bacterium]
MHLLKLAVAGLVWMTGSALAQAPQMVLSLGPHTKAPDGAACEAVMAQQDAVTQRLTEADVIGWHAEHGRMTLDPARFPVEASSPGLMDRCFALVIDGKTIDTGLALSVNTSVLTGYTTLNVITRNGVVELQLTSSNHGRHMRLVHRDALNAVLAQPANLARWRARAKDAGQYAGQYAVMGEAWSNAVRRLIDQKAIQSGMPFDDVVAQLGEPTRSAPGENGVMRYQWYFDTPMHVNPMFTLAAEQGKVTGYRLERR